MEKHSLLIVFALCGCPAAENGTPLSFVAWPLLALPCHMPTQLQVYGRSVPVNLLNEVGLDIAFHPCIPRNN
jgi:hypothetical protein